MSLRITFNNQEMTVQSLEALGKALDGFDLSESFELWINISAGPALCMLRNRQSAWLMYLRHEGDAGYVSIGQPRLEGCCRYRLGNGRIDEYPLAWCLPLEDCYKAIAYFFVNNGQRPEWIGWQAA